MEFKTALDQEQQRGILDLDAPWDPQSELPFLTIPDDNDWVEQAHLILSPFARPFGWHLKLANRSIAQALLSFSSEKGNHVYCDVQSVLVKPAPDQAPSHQQHVSEATLRVERCPPDTNTLDVLRIFSRYDLRTTGPSVVEWRPPHNKKDMYVPLTFLVHFADASWARAAMRERQGHSMKIGNNLVLARYPQQLTVNTSKIESK